MSIHDWLAVGTSIDENFTLKVNGNSYFGDVATFDGTATFTFNVGIGIDPDMNYMLTVDGGALVDSIDVKGDTTLSQVCNFSKSEARFGVSGSYTDPYNGQAAGFKFGGTIATTGAYVNGDVKAKNVIVNGGNLSFIVGSTTYKLNMSKAVELGLVTT